jgi:hypothetical protein
MAARSEGGHEMRKALFFLLLFCTVMGAKLAGGQETMARSTRDKTKPELSEELLYNEVFVYLHEGGVLTGLLCSVQSDGLVLGIGNNKKTIPFNDLQEVIIKIEKKTSRHSFYGMLTGIYLGNLIFFAAKGGPSAFLRHVDSDFGYLLWNSVFAGAGIGAGFLTSSAFGSGEKRFDFSGSQEHRLREWERFRSYALGSSSFSKKVHLSIQGGYINCRVSNRYKSTIKNASFYDYEGTTNFNLVRRVQLTYSLKPDIEVGLAAVVLSEPTIRGDKWLETMNFSGYQYFFVQQSLSSLGLYALGVYRPLRSVLPKSIRWSMGGGLGAAKVNFGLNTSLETDIYPDSIVINRNHNISKTSVSGLAFTEFDFLVDENLSFGLAADYVFVPAQRAPAFEDMGIPAQKLRFGNSSITFVLGLHF